MSASGRQPPLPAAADCSCRACGRHGLELVCDFGPMPSSDAFLEPGKPDALTPLRLAYCPGCALAQLLETPSREELFGETYLYLSSFSGAVAREAEANAASLIDRCRLGAASQVLEIACNDGYLLRHFAGRGIGVLGVEPSPVPAAAARNQGFEIVEQFFSLELATDLAGRGVRPDLVIANNVMAHVPDPGDLAAGIAHILSPEGTAVVEVHALSDLVEKLQFDTIYHEHASYFSATSIAALFARHGLVLTDLVHIPLQGGSLRLYFKQSGAPSRQVLDQMAREAASGIADGSALRTFAKRVEIAIAALKRCLTQRAAEGQSIIAYGAAAKGTMLLNHLALGPETIAYVVDQNPHKQGRLMPGVRIPIENPTRMFDSPPDAVLVLPWNLRVEILDYLLPLRQRGVATIIPLPRLEIL